MGLSLLAPASFEKAAFPKAAPKILRYTDHEPLGGMRTRFINEVFFPAIEKESNGRLKIEAHWNSEIATGYDALNAVGRKNTADMAIVVPEYTADKLPLHQIFKSFPTGPTGNQQVRFFRRVYAEIPAFSSELQKENGVNLLCATGFPVAYFSTKPLHTLKSIKGGKWRSASFWHQDFLRNAGAIPVSMPWGDGIYTALKAGALDGLMVNVDSGYQLKVQEAAPNVLISKDLWLGHVYLLVMNKNTWAALSQEDKNAFQRAAESAYHVLGTLMDTSFTVQMDELKKSGAKVRVLTNKELAEWRAATKYRDVQAAWVEKQESKGVQNAGLVLKKVNAVMDAVMK